MFAKIVLGYIIFCKVYLFSIFFLKIFCSIQDLKKVLPISNHLYSAREKYIFKPPSDFNTNLHKNRHLMELLFPYLEPREIKAKS